MKNRKGFTLVELLAVVVIMGIVIGISIPAVTAVQKRLVKQRVNTFYRVVEESADAYVEQYHSDFDGLSDCFEIPYDNLIKEDLLKETDITCLSEAFGEVQGKVIATKVNGENTYKYSFYLTCYDKENNKLLNKSDKLPEGCLGVNGGYSITVDPKHVQDSQAYDGNWISGTVRYDIEGYSPYFYPISTFQYKKEFAIEWHSENTTITDSNGKGYILFSTSNNTNPDESSLNMRVKFRAVDTGNNISTDAGWYDVKIDNTVPTVNIAYSGSGWENSDVILTFTTNSVPSGIKAFYIDLDNNGTVDATVTGGVTYTLDSNFSGTIKVKAESNTGIMGSWSNPKTIQIDKTPPTCTVTTSNANWTKDNVTITGTCHDEGGSGCATNATRTLSGNVNSNESPGQVCDGAGNCTPCGTIAVKIDNTPPTCSITNRRDSYAAEGANFTVKCSDGNGSGCSDQTKTGIKANATYTVTDGVGLTGTCSFTVSTATYRRSRTRTCSTYNRCSSAGCETYNSCQNSACGCATYKSCRNSSCTCATYNYCQNAACGTEKRCNSSSGLGCDSLGGSKSCVGCTPTGQGGSTWGICICTLSCRTSACGCQTRNYCRDSSCGCETYGSCRTSGCGCQTYKRGSACGCETFSGWGNWGSWSTSACSGNDYTQCETATWYK